jgi:hypothetical protein
MIERSESLLLPSSGGESGAHPLLRAGSGPYYLSVNSGAAADLNQTSMIARQALIIMTVTVTVVSQWVSESVSQ